MAAISDSVFAAQSSSPIRSLFFADSAPRTWAKRRERLIDAAAKDGPKAVEARADLEAMPPEPRRPLSPGLTTTEPTYEGLVKLYLEGPPALGLFTDEGGGFVGGHAMNAENRLKTVAGLSSLWDGAPINRTRAGDGAFTLRGRRLAAHMMLQPVAARPLLADPVASRQGFLARFLLVEPPSAIGSRLRRGHAAGSDYAIAAFAARLRWALEAEPPVADGTRQVLQPRRLALSREAADVLWSYYAPTEAAQGAEGELAAVRPFASESAEQAARIAGVLTLWSDLQAGSVSAEAMGWGVALAQFHLSEAKRLADAAAVSTETEQAETLRRWLLTRWPEREVLPGDVLRLGPNCLRDGKRARAAIAMLEAHGCLVRLPPGVEVRGRSRKEAYRVARPRDDD